MAHARIPDLKDISLIPFINKSLSLDHKVNVRQFQRDYKECRESKTYRITWNEVAHKYTAIANYEPISSDKPAKSITRETAYVVIKQSTDGKYQLRTLGNGSHYFLAIAKNNNMPTFSRQEKRNLMETDKVTEFIPPEKLNVIAAGSMLFSPTGTLMHIDDASGAWYRNQEENTQEIYPIYAMEALIDQGVRLEDIKHCYQSSTANVAIHETIERAKLSQILVKAEERRVSQSLLSPLSDTELSLSPRTKLNIIEPPELLTIPRTTAITHPITPLPSPPLSSRTIFSPNGIERKKEMSTPKSGMLFPYYFSASPTRSPNPTESKTFSMETSAPKKATAKLEKNKQLRSKKSSAELALPTIKSASAPAPKSPPSSLNGGLFFDLSSIPQAVLLNLPDISKKYLLNGIKKK